jgi:branched-chain amino acid aminotransferase
MLDDLIVYAKGEFRRYADARVGLLTHGLQYGTGCFEGVRGFWDDGARELYLLALAEHYERLRQSTKILTMELPLSVEALCAVTIELCARNGFERDVYLRPFAYKADEAIGVRLHDVSDEFAIVGLPFDKYFDSDAGLRVCVSSWRRIDDTVAPARAKITGIYVNSALAKSEAHVNGYDEAIMLSQDGHVSEGSAANFFMVKRGTLITPDASQNILEGITRACVIELARDLGVPVLERAIDRSELYVADEAFFTGSAAGIMWIESIDGRTIGEGSTGQITRAIARRYDDAVRGRDPKFSRWLTPVYAGRRVRAAS